MELLFFRGNYLEETNGITLTSVFGYYLSITNLVIILLKNQLFQFPMHSLHNFSLKTYHLKCLKSASNTLINISLTRNRVMI